MNKNKQRITSLGRLLQAGLITLTLITTVWYSPQAQAISVPAPGSMAVYYYHTDHLGTPQAMTDSGANVVWQADYLPFGEVEIIPQQYGIENNIRFPGQYYDAENGLHYNYFRDYSPQSGRYVESDPIGLGGGINTYGYAYQNPLFWIDPLGLTVSCIYDQVTGVMICTDDETGDEAVNETCYSGHGDGVNNPDVQDVPNVGPTPRGDYDISEGVDNRGTGPQSLPITPTASNNQFPSSRDPGSFLIHGDNSRMNRSASQGCIICSRRTRNAINSAGGGSLTVQ